MNRLVLSLALSGLAAAAVAGSALAQDAAPKGDAVHGKKIYVADGCWQCHGYQGQGGAGPKLAPTPLPYEAIFRQLRKPRGTMPVYTHVTTPDQDVADIYAYLQTMPKAKAVADIPALSSIQP
ncbi:MAG: c-type cytochrome [Caulobacteraceae bacterium]